MAKTTGLRYLRLRHIGPAVDFVYEAGERLNIITGDNSLGKTFLLESLWYALTDQWLEHAAAPRRDVPKEKPEIAFGIGEEVGRPHDARLGYDWRTHRWLGAPRDPVRTALVVYARYDGSFAIYDPARDPIWDERLRDRLGKPNLLLTRADAWDGLSVEGDNGRERWLCNGLLRDWITWQTGGERYAEHFAALGACLEALSPSPEQLQPGTPTRLPFDARDVPTLRMPYGDVPIVHAAGGVQRIATLAYVLVWAWREHVENQSLARRDPLRRMVFLVDEVEAHLHPHWQRLIVPALLEVVSRLSRDLTAQIHVATHSPLVLASAETPFNEESDALYHLRLDGQNVELERLPFVKRGRADLWLMSDVFGLGHAWSVDAERAIEDARTLQLADAPDPARVKKTHARLVRHLAQDDDFWPRWLYFAEQHGIET